ncbi:MAG TPA: oligosaccharide flippase family protein, partial [Actinomycetota bacterium]|nr:oligosaccharide flippase family protein [Actinomycetota bacterium]
MATSSSEPRGLRATLEDVLPSSGKGDQRALLGGTAQNVVGLVVTALATFGVNVLVARTQGPAALGIVTLSTQAAFVLAAGARFGMDMAAVRRVAIEVGAGRQATVRALVHRAALLCLVASSLAAAAVFAASPSIARALSSPELAETTTSAFRLAALGLPFAALVQVFLGGTRGLKIMRHTLFVFWMGHPLAWIALMVLGWLVIATADGSPGGVEVAVGAYSAAWLLATLVAAHLWRRETAAFGREPIAAGETRGLLRYGLPRAPASLLAQGLFYADLYVLARFASSQEVGVYAAVVRVGQLLMLFLVSVNLM